MTKIAGSGSGSTPKCHGWDEMSCPDWFGSFWEKGSSSSLKMSRSGFGILCAWDTPKKMRHDQDPDIQVYPAYLQYVLQARNQVLPVHHLCLRLQIVLTRQCSRKYFATGALLMIKVQVLALNVASVFRIRTQIRRSVINWPDYYFYQRYRINLR